MVASQVIVTIWYRMVEHRSKNKYERILEHNHYSIGWHEDEFHPTPVDPSFKSQASWKSGDWYKRKGFVAGHTRIQLVKVEKDIYYLNGTSYTG